MLGGAIGLAIAANVMNSWLKSHLSQTLTPSQLAALLESTDTLAALPASVQNIVRLVFAQGYTLQMKIVTGVAALQFPAILMMWKRKQLEVK
jgi:hypothetical protein